jgi:hypothetical protein
MLRNVEISHLLRTDADTFDIEGAITIRRDTAFQTRQVAANGSAGCDSHVLESID